MTGRKNGVQQGKLYSWEAALSSKKEIKNVGLLYDQLKGHIDECFDAKMFGKKYFDAEIEMMKRSLSGVINSVFYMGLDCNGEVPSVSSKYW